MRFKKRLLFMFILIFSKMPSWAPYEPSWAQLSTFEHNWAQTSTMEHNWAQLSTIEHNWAQLSTVEHRLSPTGEFLVKWDNQGRSFALNIGAARKYWDGRKGYFFGKSGFYCIFMWQSQNIGTAGAPLPPLELRPWLFWSLLVFWPRISTY